MGYELHITRAAFWAENEGHRITQAEWLHLIEQDTELVIDGQNGPKVIKDLTALLGLGEGSQLGDGPSQRPSFG